MLKVKLFRWVVDMMPLVFWRKKAPQNLLVEDRSIPVSGGQINIRIYRPETQAKLPVTLFFHGGGYVVGSLKSCDPLCRELAAKPNQIVISVAYRLGPEHPFPTAVQDGLAAFDWLTQNAEAIGANPDKIFIGGDSAGANMATVVALQARASHPNVVKGQLLLYPMTHHYSNETPSYMEYLKGGALNREMMTWFWDCYYEKSTILAPGQYTHELSTPLALDDVSGLPPALLIMAQIDPLRDEGIDYANKLESQGVQVQQTVYPGVEHGFIGYMGPTEEHNRGMDEVVQWYHQINGDALFAK